MSFYFTPKTEEELNAFDLLDPGVYDFEVTKCARRTSKSGNPMAELQLCIWNKEGKTSFIFDYLVFSDINLNIRKVKHFCDAVGLSEAYKAGNLPEDLVGKGGKADLGIQEEIPNPKGGIYPKKNVVVDYVMTDKGAIKVQTGSDFIDSDVPF